MFEIKFRFTFSESSNQKKYDVYTKDEIFTCDPFRVGSFNEINFINI